MVNHGANWSEGHWKQKATWHQSNAGQATYGNNPSWRSKGPQQQYAQDEEQQGAAPTDQAVVQRLGDDRAGRSGGAGRGVERTLLATYTRATQDQPAPGLEMKKEDPFPELEFSYSEFRNRGWNWTCRAWTCLSH